MELFFTEAASLRRAVTIDGTPLLVDGEPYSIPADAAQVLKDDAIPDGMPFALDKDGLYEASLNRFFRDLPAIGCRSVNTWQAYARDIVTFSRFLEERCGGKRLLDAVIDDVRLYYRTRRMTGIHSVDPTTWNRSVAALDKFFQWAFEQKLIQVVPFTYKTVNQRLSGMEAPQIVSHNNALEKVGGGDTIKCVRFEDYLTFRNVGLLGQLPDGTMDPHFRGRNRLRNAAFAEVLVTTGVRLEEGGSILRAELPDPEAPKWRGFRSCKMRLGRLVTKGDKERSIWFPKRVLSEYVLPYVQEDRDNATLGAVHGGLYRNTEDSLMVSAWRQTGCTVRSPDGSVAKLEYDSLSHGDRRRLYTVTRDGISESGMLWLTESGLPTTLNNFEVVFSRACERCATFGIQLSITPHTLRHTFAVYMLSHLIKGVIDGGTPTQATTGEGVYRRIIADPLRTLQRMLGHASITTTYKYLTYLEEAEELVDAAVGSWGDRLGAPSNGIDIREAS